MNKKILSDSVMLQLHNVASTQSHQLSDLLIILTQSYITLVQTVIFKIDDEANKSKDLADFVKRLEKVTEIIFKRISKRANHDTVEAKSSEQSRRKDSRRNRSKTKKTVLGR